MWSEFASTHGLTPASLIKVVDRRYDYNQGGYITSEFLCTVGAELPENLNVFALGQDSKQQEIKIPLIGYKPEYGNNIISARTLVKSISDDMANTLFAYNYSWGNVQRMGVIAQSSYKFSDEWYNQSPMEDIEYALKKWNKEQMSDFLRKCTKLVDDCGGDYGIA